jgi:N-acetylglucosamine-6-sulfatase
MRKLVALVLAAVPLVGVSLVSVPRPAAEARPRPNVVILITDDQRWDKVTPRYMPQVYRSIIKTPSNGFPNSTSSTFTNAFVPNPLCCPSRTSILSGDYSHTTGVWDNVGRYGGFGAFHDGHTVAVDFDRAGYRTAMIGKYLNGYVAGSNRYVPPGWDRWFAASTGAYYNYGITADGRLRHYGGRPQDYMTRVLSRQAVRFVRDAQAAGGPFFLYYSFTAPHMPATPDPRDLTRFKGETNSAAHDNMLESAYGADRAIGRLLSVLAPNTVVLFMSDNGYLWGEPKGDWGQLAGKKWPYDESIRVPVTLASLNGSYRPRAGAGDVVLNVDLRTTLTHAAGLAPLTSTEGHDWGGTGYKPRWVFPLEHVGGSVPTYCGSRTRDWMYVRYHLAGGGYQRELYHETGPGGETANLIGDPAYRARQQRMQKAAEGRCDPPPPGYHWPSG